MRNDAWLKQAAAQWPAQVAVEAADGSLTYAQLSERAESAAQTLAAADPQPGSRYPLDLKPSCEFVVQLHAAWLAGMAAVPLDPRWSEREKKDRLALAQGGRSDPAVAALLFTSGTEGVPKPVELSFENFAASAAASAERIGAEPRPSSDRWLCALPLSHVAGFSIPVRCAIAGATVALYESFDAECVTEELMGGTTTVISLVPTMLKRLLDAGLCEPSSLRCALVGGAPITQQLLERAEQAGVPVALSYGLTEACSQVATSRPGDFGNVRPVLNTTVEIAADGEVLVSGPTVAKDSIAADGWLHTGDLGELNADGCLTLLARKSELIITGGENVMPAEVEAVLELHTAIAEALVYSKNSPEWGEAVVADVVLNNNKDLAEINLPDHCATHLAHFKIPKEFRTVTELPHTPTGKLRRQAAG